MAEKNTKMTPEEFARKKKELEDLKVNKRREAAIALQEARAQGDLSENAEYDAARDAKRDLEQQITELEDLLDHAEIVDISELPTDEINMGSIVTLFDYDEEEEVTYTIVSATETDSLAGKISLEAPLGAAMNKKRVGDEIEVRGFKYKIVRVER